MGCQSESICRKDSRVETQDRALFDSEDSRSSSPAAAPFLLGFSTDCVKSTVVRDSKLISIISLKKMPLGGPRAKFNW